MATSTAAAAAATAKERSQLAGAAQDFEAIFLRQMLSAARDSAIRSDLFGSNGSDTFRQMRDEAFADIASQQGVLGLAAMIEAQVASADPQTPGSKE